MAGVGDCGCKYTQQVDIPRYNIFYYPIPPTSMQTAEIGKS